MELTTGMVLFEHNNKNEKLNHWEVGGGGGVSSQCTPHLLKP